ncbi:MAG: SAM-dependent chlorinase/fluorinase [Gemmatimonadota bacterium]
MTLITLLTDFGTSDSYVAEVKGVLACHAAGVSVVDITHEISPGDIGAAAYVFGRAWHRFPPGTVHLVIVDPGVGTERAAIAFAAGGALFVGPDNGVLSSAFAHRPDQIVALALSPEAAPTFHGRDIFAPAAAALATGTPPSALGVPFPGSPVTRSLPEPHHEGKTLIGTVIYIDRFGNLVTNLTPAMVPSYATLEVEESLIGGLRRTFGDVPPGGLVAYTGSAGSVEIAVREGSAARRLGIGVGGRVRVRLG